MLQQTRSQTVLPYYERFLRELPDVHALAEAPLGHVLALWSGLGYYRRARMLHAAAKTVATKHAGRLPEEPAELRRLPGIGPYTAGAVASIAFGKPAALVDGNVARVLARLYGVEQDVKSAAGAARMWELAEHLVARREGANPGDWNQALMELGATVCVPGNPRCAECPLASLCEGKRRGIAAELPRTAPKRAVPVVERVAVVLASPTHVFLARRRPGLLFGGLWEPPAADATERGALLAALGLGGRALRDAGSVVHVLSHRRLHVHVEVGDLPARGRTRARWGTPRADYDAAEAVSLAELRDGTRAHASLARKVLEVAGVLTLAKAPHRGLRSSSE
jgi:A/G-specific adenine glycosylase